MTVRSLGLPKIRRFMAPMSRVPSGPAERAFLRSKRPKTTSWSPAVGRLDQVGDLLGRVLAVVVHGDDPRAPGLGEAGEVGVVLAVVAQEAHGHDPGVGRARSRMTSQLPSSPPSLTRTTSKVSPRPSKKATTSPTVAATMSRLLKTGMTTL